jgi:small-conductance mechanosensitive channel
MNDIPDTSPIFRHLDASILVEVAAILITAVLLILFMQRAVSWLGRRLYGRRRLSLLALVPLLRLAIGLTAVLLIVPLLVEPTLRNMIALLGATGIALGFALKDYASSLIAGVVAIGEKPYRNGDWIRLGDTYGEVTHVGMRTVDVRTPDDDRVSIPQGRIWTDAVSNANDGKPRLLCIAEFHLHPDHDGLLVRELLRDVALSSPYLHLDSSIAVIAAERPWGSVYRLKAYPVDSAQQFRFTTDMTLRGKAALRRRDIAFARSPVLAEADS